MKQPQLLLIDDEPALADFVANAARECGFDPTVAWNDASFREKFKEQRPDAVAMDLGMPVDGVELLRFLSDEDFQGPVLIISGFDRRVLEFRFPARRGTRAQHGWAARKAGAVGRTREPAETAQTGGAFMTAADRKLLESFERALAAQQLRLVYQPKVSLKDGKLGRVEALVRWDDPELGPVSPSRFVPLAEKHGLIDPLTEWGLRETLKQWRRWREQGLETRLAFNISAISLQRLDFPDLVERMCTAMGVPTDRLVLELTEGATQPLVRLMDTLTRFRIKGMGLAIDDFGTGYSSLLQLRQLPFTEVKIDRCFVADLPDAHDSRLIVKTIADLAHGLGLVATAEGVETVEQLRAVRELGCDVVQGFLVAAPLDPNDLIPWNKEFKKRWPALLSDESLELWGDVEANALSKR